MKPIASSYKGSFDLDPSPEDNYASASQDMAKTNGNRANDVSAAVAPIILPWNYRL